MKCFKIFFYFVRILPIYAGFIINQFETVLMIGGGNRSAGSTRAVASSRFLLFILLADAGGRGDLFDQRPLPAPDPAGVDQVMFQVLA
jgi:hypothetical protein